MTRSSFTQSHVCDGKENPREKMAVRNPGGRKHKKGETTGNAKEFELILYIWVIAPHMLNQKNYNVGFMQLCLTSIANTFIIRLRQCFH